MTDKKIGGNLTLLQNQHFFPFCIIFQKKSSKKNFKMCFVLKAKIINNNFLFICFPLILYGSREYRESTIVDKIKSFHDFNVKPSLW